ncbi:MAG: hypothetical protein J0I28_01300 [Caulobacterales bacterium]|nr:hypothetical protein [Caulobacterales bacterium]
MRFRGVLLGYYQSKAGIPVTTNSTGSSSTSTTKYAPTAPWATGSKALPMSDLVKKAMSGQRLINEGANQLDLQGASDDYRKLFALYQGLNALQGIASRWNEKGVTDAEKARLQSVFEKGLAEVKGYAEGIDLDQLRLTRGEVLDSLQSGVGVPKNATTYVTQTLHTGSSSTEVAAFTGAAKFTIAVKQKNVTTNIDIDLSEMGSTPRTMGAVSNFINGKLEDAGFRTRFSVQRTAAEPRTVTVNNKPVTLPAVGDAFAFKISGDSTEALTFSAAQTDPAVYVVTKGGDPDPDDDTKTDDAVYETKLSKYDPTGAKVFGETLDPSISQVRKSITGPDGSVYMLAEVEGAKVEGQTLKSGQDVALMKYDSAGNLVYSRTLGAAGEASGLNLALSADGKVAVAGSITGALGGATNGALNSSAASGKPDSFVTLYDAEGDEVWTVRKGAMQEDEAQAVAFDADGNVLVAGRTKSALPGGTALQGGYDNYLTSISTDAKGAAKTLFTKTFGTTGNDSVSGMVVDGGNVYLADVENGRGVVRSFAVSGAVATAGATRDLGDLQGGSIAGLAIENGNLYVGGQTRNGSLSVGGAGAAAGGGMDAFAAKFSTTLSDTSADTLAYFGGTGTESATAMAVANGKVYLTGVSGDAPATKGGQDGYLATLDMSNGTLSASQKLTGKDGYVAPTSLTVDAQGSSVLDKFGLPRGTLDYTASQKVVAATSARPGDTFQIRASDGSTLKTITIEANDTLQTLATKVSRAAGFRAKVEVVSDGDVRRLKISPTTDSSTVEVLAGKGGADALSALGLSEGIVRKTKMVDGKSVPADGGSKIYGLKLDTTLSLNDADSVKLALADISTALSSVKTIYRDLENAAKPKSAVAQAAAAGKNTGVVPQYMKNQIANYQAALDRLTGGG